MPMLSRLIKSFVDIVEAIVAIQVPNVDRSKVVVISMEQFLDLDIDYRPLGKFEIQLKKLEADFRHFHWAACEISQDKMLEVEKAFRIYVGFLRSDYTIVI